MGIFCRPKRLLVAGLVTSLSPEPRFEVIQSVLLAGRRPVADHNESLPHESQRSRICYSALGLGLLLYVWPAIYMVGSGWFVRSGFAVTGIEVPDEGSSDFEAIDDLRRYDYAKWLFWKVSSEPTSTK